MLTISPLPDDVLRNSRDPIDANSAPRCLTGWELRLTETGLVWVSACHYYGGDGTPMDEWLMRTLTWAIRAPGDGSVIDKAKLETDLAEGGQIRVLLNRVHAGHDVNWDGQNQRGSLDDDATEANEALAEILRDYAEDDTAPEQWDAYTWLTSDFNNPVQTLEDSGLTTDATDEQIAAAIERAAAIAKDDNIELIDAEDAFRTLIFEAKEAAGDDQEEAAS